MLDEVIKHHETWKHQSNPNLLPHGKHLEIEFLKDLSNETKLLAQVSARKFNVNSDEAVSVDGHSIDVIGILIDINPFTATATATTVNNIRRL